MTIRPGQPLSCNSPPKPSFKGMDVVMMNDFEQRHRTSAKSRSHSPFGHIGSPTTPLNFEQLFQLNSELSHHDHSMLQAQLLNTMRNNNTSTTTTMAPKPKIQHQQSQPSLAMLDHLRQAYNSQEQQADWNAREEPSTIALLQQKFAQLERHKAEMQKPQQQVQIYPSQWPIANSMPPPPPPVSSAPYSESRFGPTSSTFYSFQQPPSDVPEQFSWRDAPSQMVYQQFQHQVPQPKVVDYQHHRVPEFAVAPQPSPSFSGFQLNAPPPPPAAAAVQDMALLGVSSRCDKTGGHSVEIKSVQDHYADSEMSLDNFSGRIMPQVQQPAPTSSQITFSNNFHMLPQSSKSAFTTFTRPSSNLNPHQQPEAVVTKSLLFNDPYRRSQELPESLHDDVDTELHL